MYVGPFHLSVGGFLVAKVVIWWLFIAQNAFKYIVENQGQGQSCNKAT